MEGHEAEARQLEVPGMRGHEIEAHVAVGHEREGPEVEDQEVEVPAWGPGGKRAAHVRAVVVKEAGVEEHAWDPHHEEAFVAVEEQWEAARWDYAAQACLAAVPVVVVVAAFLEGTRASDLSQGFGAASVGAGGECRRENHQRSCLDAGLEVDPQEAYLHVEVEDLGQWNAKHSCRRSVAEDHRI